MVYPRVTSRASSFMVVLEITTISQLWDDILSYNLNYAFYMEWYILPQERDSQGFLPLMDHPRECQRVEPKGDNKCDP